MQKKKTQNIAIFLLIMLIPLTGCNLSFLNTNQQNEFFQPISPIQGQSTLSPDVLQPSADDQFFTDGESKWLITLKGDPGIQAGIYTQLPMQKLTFIVTFSQEVDPASVEEAFLRNLLPDDIEEDVKVPELKLTWLNPIQLELTFPGEDAQASTVYTLSPKGARNAQGDLLFNEDDDLKFQIVPNKKVYHIDRKGKITKQVQEIPNSLQPISLSKDGGQWLLGRFTQLDRESTMISYLYDPIREQIVKIIPEHWEIPFWGANNELYILTDKTLIQMNQHDERWLESAQYPFIHGWSISPSMKYEVSLRSKTWEQDKTKVSLLIKDLINEEEWEYENLVSANTPNERGELTHFQISWLPSEERIFISSPDRKQKNWLFNIDTGEKEEAPEYLNNQPWSQPPQWSADGEFLSVDQKGIFDQHGNLIIDWSQETFQPIFAPKWHPYQPILAYEAQNKDGKYIVQLNVKTGEQILTEGEYQLFDWDRLHEGLLVLKDAPTS